MKRFYAALDVATSITCPTLQSIVVKLNDAVTEAVADGIEPVNDPAVLLLGAFVAFHTHADVNTVGGYRRLIGLCQASIEQENLQ